MSTTYAYNDALRKVTITNPYNEVTQLTRDTSQRLSRKDFGNGTYETYGYDSRNRPNSILLKNSGGATLSSQSYAYDNASNVTNHTQDGVSTTYGYDSIDQLTSETRSGYSASYTYDANGNRTSRTVNGLVESYSNDLGDKLTSVTWNGGYKNYAYDAAGRMTSVTTAAGVTTLNYDYEDRVTAISFAGGGYATNTYNGLDTRVGRTDKFIQPWTYKRDGAGVTAPLLSDGSSNFTPGASVRTSGTSTYQHAGIKNDTRQTGSNQTVSASRQYVAFGGLTSTSGTWIGPFGYGGDSEYQEDGDSGLALLGHRYLDRSTGRFLTRDPIEYDQNRYSYCENNPVSYYDSDGLVQKVPDPGLQAARKGRDIIHAGTGPGDCQDFIALCYTGVHPGPSANYSANQLNGWYGKSDSWEEIKRSPDYVMRPGDVLVEQRKKGHGHVRLVGVDDSDNAQIIDASIGYNKEVVEKDKKGKPILVMDPKTKKMKPKMKKVWVPPRKPSVSKTKGLKPGERIWRPRLKGAIA